MANRPGREEYNAHFEGYVSVVPEGDIRDILTQSLVNTTNVFTHLSENQAHFRYAEGKWSLKEVLGHITDNERIMSYRLLRIARGDKTPLTGYDENVLVRGAAFDSCSMLDLIADYTAVRRATLTLLQGLPEEAWVRRGMVSGSESSALAWAYIIAGHELHHLNVVNERYLNHIR